MQQQRERWEITDKLLDLQSSLRPDVTTRAKCYISGPMTGLPYFNFPAFEAAASLLRDAGWHVYSPRENDSEAGIEPDPEGKLQPDGPLFKDLMRTDLWQVCDADAVIVLPGWEYSAGAQIEVDVAHRVGVPVYSLLSCREIEAPPYQPHDFSSRLSAAEEVVEPVLDCGPKYRYTDPETGGEKEESLARYDLVPPDSLTELAKVYGYGEQKYPSGPDGPNYLRGYPWHLSVASLERHVQKYKAGEDIDPETGLHHLAHAAWHAFALIAFGRRGLGRDDRVKLKAA